MALAEGQQLRAHSEAVTVEGVRAQAERYGHPYERRLHCSCLSLRDLEHLLLFFLRHALAAAPRKCAPPPAASAHRVRAGVGARVPDVQAAFALRVLCCCLLAVRCAAARGLCLRGVLRRCGCTAGACTVAYSASSFEGGARVGRVAG